jgi:hypothetical protein
MKNIVKKSTYKQQKDEQLPNQETNQETTDKLVTDQQPKIDYSADLFDQIKFIKNAPLHSLPSVQVLLTTLTEQEPK